MPLRNMAERRVPCFRNIIEVRRIVETYRGSKKSAKSAKSVQAAFGVVIRSGENDPVFTQQFHQLRTYKMRFYNGAASGLST